MNKQRLAQLLEFLEEEPNDPFNKYAIAIEYLEEKPMESLKYFQELLQNHENYTGTYYHAAKLYNALGNKEEAERVFLKGIEICRSQKDHHALRELQNAYNEFLFEEEDD